MKQVHSGLKGQSFSSTRPSGVVTATICRDSGLLPNEYCILDPRGDRTYTEYFVKGTVPTKTCETHVSVNICKDSGLIATAYCPNIETKVFITRPNSDTSTSWQRAKDAEYMLTIKDNCNLHISPPDITKPTITLKGDSTITININEAYVEQGATATDNIDGDITSKIVISGSVDKTTAGTYTLTYSVKDTSGNETNVTRTVKVKDSAQIVNNTNTNTNNNTNTNTNTNTNNSI